MDLVPLSHEVWILDGGSGANLECVGTILSSYLILTAASCLYEKAQGPSGFSIRTKSGMRSGQTESSSSKLEEEQIRNVGSLHLHPEFLNSSLKNDLAILVLDENLNSVPTLNILNIGNPALDDSSFMNFSGHLCREDSEVSPLEISLLPFQYSQFASQSDKLCLLPKNSRASVNCSMPPAGSSLICADENRGEFLCGILAVSLKNVGENEGKGQIYTNLTHHLPWLQSNFSKAKGETDEPSKLKKADRVVAPEPDFDYEVGAHVPGPVEDYPVGPTIVNGTDVSKSDPLPYQLSIRFQENPGEDKWRHHCGAVILDKNTALTAAHCFRKTMDAWRYRVVAGDNRLVEEDKEEQTLSIREITIHPDFNFRENVTQGNDIAILHVDNPGFEFNKSVQGVWLSRLSIAKLSSTPSVISGWGQISNELKPSNTLQRGDLSILPDSDCKRRLIRNKASLSGIMCAWSTDTRSCFGDSGGPLVIPNYTVGNTPGNLLVGLISFGPTNCNITNSAVFLTEINHFWAWIQQNRVKTREEKKPNPPQSTTTKAPVEKKKPNPPKIPIPTTENYKFATPFIPTYQPPYPNPASSFVGVHSSTSCVNNQCTETITGPGGTQTRRHGGGTTNGQQHNFNGQLHNFNGQQQNFNSQQHNFNGQQPYSFHYTYTQKPYYFHYNN